MLARYEADFVIGMTYIFGAILPTGVGSILALICAVIYLYLRRAIFFGSKMPDYSYTPEYFKRLLKISRDVDTINYYYKCFQKESRMSEMIQCCAVRVFHQG